MNEIFQEREMEIETEREMEIDRKRNGNGQILRNEIKMREKIENEYNMN